MVNRKIICWRFLAVESQNQLSLQATKVKGQSPSRKLSFLDVHKGDGRVKKSP